MGSRYPRHGDRWDDRDRQGDIYDRDRGLSPESGPFRTDEEYFGQGESYGRIVAEFKERNEFRSPAFG